MAAGNNTLVAKATSWPDRYADICIEMKELWDKLSNEDVRLYHIEPEQFFIRLKEKQGVSREVAERCMAQIKAECGCDNGRFA